MGVDEQERQQALGRGCRVNHQMALAESKRTGNGRQDDHQPAQVKAERGITAKPSESVISLSRKHAHLMTSVKYLPITHVSK